MWNCGFHDVLLFIALSFPLLLETVITWVSNLERKEFHRVLRLLDKATVVVAF